MNTMQVIETPCKIIEDALGAIRDEETQRQLEAACQQAVGEEGDEYGM